MLSSEWGKGLHGQLWGFYWNYDGDPFRQSQVSMNKEDIPRGLSSATGLFEELFALTGLTISDLFQQVVSWNL